MDEPHSFVQKLSKTAWMSPWLLTYLHIIIIFLNVFNAILESSRRTVSVHFMHRGKLFPIEQNKICNSSAIETAAYVQFCKTIGFGCPQLKKLPQKTVKCQKREAKT